MVLFYQAALFLLPGIFVGSFVLLLHWWYFKQYAFVNLSLILIYTLLITYLTRNASDGWGVAIFGLLFFYGHFIISILTALFIRFIHLGRQKS